MSGNPRFESTRLGEPPVTARSSLPSTGPRTVRRPATLPLPEPEAPQSSRALVAATAIVPMIFAAVAIGSLVVIWRVSNMERSQGETVPDVVRPVEAAERAAAPPADASAARADATPRTAPAPAPSGERAARAPAPTRDPPLASAAFPLPVPAPARRDPNAAQAGPDSRPVPEAPRARAAGPVPLDVAAPRDAGGAAPAPAPAAPPVAPVATVASAVRSTPAVGKSGTSVINPAAAAVTPNIAPNSTANTGTAPLAAPPAVALNAASLREEPLVNLVARNRPTPDMPLRAKRAHIDEGRFEVMLHVDAQGRVASVELVHAEPPEVYDDSVRDTLAKWTFDPPGRSVRKPLSISFRP